MEVAHVGEKLGSLPLTSHLHSIRMGPAEY